MTERVVVRCPHPHMPCSDLFGAKTLDAARGRVLIHLRDRHYWEHGSAELLASCAPEVKVVVLEGEPAPVLDGPQPDPGRPASRQPTAWRDAAAE